MKSLPKLHCDHCHNEVYVDKIRKAHIGMPCPICGTSMLSAKEYKIARNLKWLERASKAILILFPSQRKNMRRIHVHVRDDKIDILKTSDDVK